jgi:hypothetical protein
LFSIIFFIHLHLLAHKIFGLQFTLLGFGLVAHKIFGLQFTLLDFLLGGILSFWLEIYSAWFLV